MAIIGGEPQKRRRKGGQEEVDCSLAPYMRLLQVHVCMYMYHVGLWSPKKDLGGRRKGCEVQVINHVTAGLLEVTKQSRPTPYFMNYNSRGIIVGT